MPPPPFVQVPVIGLPPLRTTVAPVAAFQVIGNVAVPESSGRNSSGASMLVGSGGEDHLHRVAQAGLDQRPDPDLRALRGCHRLRGRAGIAIISQRRRRNVDLGGAERTRRNKARDETQDRDPLCGRDRMTREIQLHFCFLVARCSNTRTAYTCARSMPWVDRHSSRI